MRSAPEGWRVARRFLLGLAVLIGIYSAAGFHLVPHLLQTRLWPLLGGQWSAEGISLNPLTLTLAVHGFVLRDPSGRELASVAAARVDIDGVESLRQRALVLSGALQNPRVSIELGKDGVPNFAFLLRPADARSSSEPANIAPFRIVRLTLTQGRLSFFDPSREQVFKAVLSPLDFSVENLGNVSGETARFSLVARGESQDELQAHGSLKLAPTDSEGEVKLKNFRLAPLAPYLSALEPFRVRGGRLSLGIRYRLRGDTSGTRFEVPSAQARVQDLALVEAAHGSVLQVGSLIAKGFTLKPDLERMGLSSVAVRKVDLQAGNPSRGSHVDAVDLGDIALDLGERSLSIAAVSSGSGRLTAWRSPEGKFALQGMPSAPVSAADDPWHIKVGRVDLRQYEALFTDLSVTPPVQLKLAPVNLRLKDFSSDANTAFKIGLDTGLGKNGHVEAEGKVILRPLLIADLHVALDRLGMGRFQPYLDRFTRFTLNKGRLSAAGDFNYYEGPVDSIRFSGDAAIVGMSTAEQRGGKDLVSWKELQLNGLIFETTPKRLSIREVIATEPYANVVIGEDGKVNVVQALAGPPGSSTPSRRIAGSRMPKSGTGQDETLPVVIGALRLDGGRADFADLTLQPLHFAVGIGELRGSVRGLSSQKDARADVLLEGKLEQNAPVRIAGQINPFSPGAHTDIALQFHSVNLSTLSPYSSKFAGYRIEKGKVSMDLRYRLNNDELVADNRFRLDRLTLGERVESPDATSLPVKLAVALLKDGSGRIDLDLPISGDLRDPRVSIRGLLANAAVQLLTKLVSTPAVLLGGLAPDDGEDLGNVNFEAGSSLLKPAEKEKLARVSRALKEKPALTLEIKGEANPAQDRQALAERELLRHLQNARRLELRGEGTPVQAGEEIALTDEDFRRLFTDYCRTRMPDSPEILALSASGTRLLSGKALEDARRRVLESWSVGELELRSLARARGLTVRDYFVKEAGMPDERIFLLDVRFADPDEKQIKAMLSLGGS